MGANIKHTLANKYTNLMNQILTKLETQPEVKVLVATNSIAHKTRFNCYSARKRVREFNAEMYPDVTDPRHGVSIYDELIFTIKTGDKILTVTKMGDEDFEFIEEPSTDLGGTDPINDQLSIRSTGQGERNNTIREALDRANDIQSSEIIPLDKEGTE